MPGCVDEVDNIGMPLEDSLRNMSCIPFRDPFRGIAHHDIHFLLDLGEHGLVGHGDTLQDMVRCAIHRGRRPHEIDMRESTWTGVKSLESPTRR